MGSMQDLILDDFPIETDVCNSVYSALSHLMYDREHPGIRESGLYGTRAFYNPEASEVLPLLFGTLYSGSEYAEVLFSKAGDEEKGKLEVKLFGDNEEKLLEIKQKIKVKIDKILENNKNGK
jgi:hypothetical protein